MARIVFYCHDTRANIDAFEYYRQDIEAFESLGHEVTISTRYREIPRHFDLIFIWWWTHALYPVILARLRSRPCFITGIFNFRFPPGFEGTDYLHRPMWQRFLIGLATRACTLNLFPYDRELGECSAHFHLSNARAYAITVHDDYLQGPAREREMAIFNLAWSGKGNLIRKGIPELLRAVRLLRDRGRQIPLLLAGPPGDGADYLRGLIDELELSQAVTLLGTLSREEKIERLRRCEIYAQPSHFEGFGLATAEAMGSGACIVTCDVGAVRSVVGEAGVYVTPGSPEELALALEQVIGDGALRQRLQRAAHDRARSHFTADRKRDRLAALLAEAGI